MFIWLASYPKSGNTLLRSMLAAYFFSKDGIYNFSLIRNIRQFPNTHLFKNLGIDVNNQKEVVKNYINVQKSFNKKNSVQFLKTHSYLFNIENNAFTDLNNSLGVIYLVRDPRNVVTSWARFANVSIENAANTLINVKHFGGDEKTQEPIVHMGTWDGNFQSWKSFKHQERYLLIKYEDLIADREKYFLESLKFIYKLNNTDFILDKSKFNNVLDTTSFEKLQRLENEEGFFEAKKDKKTGKKIPFFNLGPKNDWKKLLDQKIREKIEKAFRKEMIELNYLQ